MRNIALAAAVMLSQRRHTGEVRANDDDAHLYVRQHYHVGGFDEPAHAAHLTLQRAGKHHDLPQAHRCHHGADAAEREQQHQPNCVDN